MRVSCSFASLFSPRFPSPTLDGELHSNKNLVVMPDAWNSARHNIGSPYFLNNKWSAFHRGERLRPVRSLPRVSGESGKSGRRAANSRPEKCSSRSRSSRVPPPRPREDLASARQRIFLASTEYLGAAHVPPRAAPPHVRFPSPGVLSQSSPPLSSRSRSRGQSLCPRALSRRFPEAADTRLLDILLSASPLTPPLLTVSELRILFPRASGTMDRKREKMRKQLNH